MRLESKHKSKALTNPLIPINKAVIDSLSLKIPFSECNIIDERLTSQTCIYYETLDMIDCELHPPKPIVIIQDGITVRVSLTEIPIYNKELDKHETTKFIVLTLSSKLLRTRYFEGIHKHNLMYLYNQFMYMNVFRCSLETFINGHISDIDICINLYVEHPSIYHDALNLIVTDCGVKAKYCHLINENQNLGLTINTRHSAKPSLPFIKLYYKEYELLTKSAEFYNKFLFPEYGQAIKKLTRIECTIRNAHHKRRLIKHNIIPEYTTLKEFVEIPESNLREFVVFSLKSYIEPQFRIKSPDLSPTDHIIFQLIQNCYQKGYDKDSLLQIADLFDNHNKDSTDVARSRIRSKIKSLSDLILNTDLKIAAKENYNHHVISYLNQLNLKI